MSQIKEFWNMQQQESLDFLKRSSTVYSSANIQDLLGDRSITNALLDSLIQFLPDGAYIAGGFMTEVVSEGKSASDIDIFFRDGAACEATMNLLLHPPEDAEAWAWKGYSLASNEIMKEFNEHSENYRFLKFIHSERIPIQLIKLCWYPSAEAVIDSFDLTIAQFAVDGKGTFTYNPLGIFDIVRKRLVLHRMQFPSSTLRRVIKYTKKGYYACGGSLIKICENVQKALNENHPMDIDIEQVIYVD